VLFRFVSTLILLKEREINLIAKRQSWLCVMSALVVSARQDREVLTFYCFCYCYCCFVAIALAIFDNGVVLNDCFGNSYILGSDRRIDLTSRENVVSNDCLGWLICYWKPIDESIWLLENSVIEIAIVSICFCCYCFHLLLLLLLLFVIVAIVVSCYCC
jgi:hypothetical protein